MAFTDAFRFSFGPDISHWYYWNNGSLGLSDVPVYVMPPNKWRDTETKWKRSIDTRGLIRGIAAPFDFMDTTAMILRAIFYPGTIESKVFFKIERLNTDTVAYEAFFDGEIDLSTFVNGSVYNNGPRSVGAAVIEGGIGAMLDAAGDTAYPIALNPADCDLIKTDGTKLRANYHNISMSRADTGYNHTQLMAFELIGASKDGGYDVGEQKSQTNYMAMGTPLGPVWSVNSAEHNNFLYKANQTVLVQMNVNHEVYYTNPLSNTLDFHLETRIYVATSISGTPYQVLTFYNDLIDGPAAPLHPGDPPRRAIINKLSNSFTMNADDRLYYVLYISGPGAGGSATSSVVFYGTQQIDIQMQFRPATSVTAAYPLRTVVDKLLTAITGQTGMLQSDYLTQPVNRDHYLNPYNVRLTCGDALRGLTTNAAGDINVLPEIKISWRNMMRYLKYVYGCGMDIRAGKVVIEKAGFFFNKDLTIADVGEVANLKDEPARDYYFASGKWGYPSQDYNKLNGKDEPNTNCVWKYPINRVTTQEDATVIVRHDPYGIEEARFNLSGKKTTDSNSDNDTFAIETESATVSVTIGSTAYACYPIYRPQNSFSQPAVTGFLFPDTMYNLTFLPYLNLMRSSGMISAMLFNMPGGVLKFLPTADQKNPQIFINLGAGTFNATGDIAIADLDPATFRAQLLHFDAYMKSTFLASMRANPSGCVKLYENGILYKGFPVEAGVLGAEDNSYNLSVLATADTDLSPRMS